MLMLEFSQLIPVSHRLFALFIRRQRGSKIKQIVNDRGLKINVANETLQRAHISSNDMNILQTFANTGEDAYTTLGRDLKKRIAYQVQWFKSLSESTKKTITIPGRSDNLPSMDNFLLSFNKLYLTSESFRGELLIDLMKALVAKFNGLANPRYGQRVLNFMLALSASGDRKAFQYVSANLWAKPARRSLFLFLP